MTQTPEWHREILKSRSESPAAWLDWEETKTSLRQLADDVNKGIAQIERGETVPFDLDAMKAALRARLRENDPPA
jgi:Trp operon repressor